MKVVKPLYEMSKILHLSYITNENAIFIGDAGTGKSLVARCFCRSMENGNKYFSYLVSKFTTPDEIFGVVDLESYKKGVFKRITKNKLPDADVAFLDEIFNGSSAILNTLLTILNERVFFNPDEQKINAFIISASNKPPSNDELKPLYDRFTFKYFIKTFSPNETKNLFAVNTESLENELIEFNKDVFSRIKQIKKVKTTNQELNTILDLLSKYIIDNDIELTNRKRVKIPKIIKYFISLVKLNIFQESDIKFVVSSLISDSFEQFEQNIVNLSKIFISKDEIIEKIKNEIEEIRKITPADYNWELVSRLKLLEKTASSDKNLVNEIKELKEYIENKIIEKDREGKNE